MATETCQNGIPWLSSHDRLSKITDTSLHLELKEIFKIKTQAYTFAEQIINQTKKLNKDPFCITEEKTPSGWGLANKVRNLNGEFGEFHINLSGQNEIILRRILEETALFGLKIKKVLTETIKIVNDGSGQITIEQAENPDPVSFKGIFRKPTPIAHTKITFNTSSSKEGNRKLSLFENVINTDIHPDILAIMEDNPTLLDHIIQFRERMEKTLESYKSTA